MTLGELGRAMGMTGLGIVDPALGDDDIKFSLHNPPVEMLRITRDGFWVRGQKVEQGPDEARVVYDAVAAFFCRDLNEQAEEKGQFAETQKELSDLNTQYLGLCTILLDKTKRIRELVAENKELEKKLDEALGVRERETKEFELKHTNAVGSIQSVTHFVQRAERMFNDLLG